MNLNEHIQTLSERQRVMAAVRLAEEIEAWQLEQDIAYRGNGARNAK